MKALYWIILIIVSVGIGTFFDVNVLEKMDINIWVSRGIGCLISAIAALILYHFLLKKYRQ
jgi:hypothetical protein